METLPEEMVEKIGQQLTPEDLTHCCGVSKEWRRAFNLDRLWKRFCDPALEEHLRTTPSIVEPLFVIPGGEGSTLVPLCQWRLAFLREKHLNNNWKNNYHRTEAVPGTRGEKYREFLTDTLIVRWFPDRFQIWDVGVDPAVLATEYSFGPDFREWFDAFVENSLLVVRLWECVKVFTINIDKSVLLKRDISFEEVKTESALSEYKHHLDNYKGKRLLSGLGCVNKNVYVHVNATRRNLDIFDLGTGMKIKEEPCPSPVNVDMDVEIFKVFTSATSDFVVVVVRWTKRNSIYRIDCYYYIYDLQKLSFAPRCLARGMIHSCSENYGEIHGDYVLFSETVFNCRSFEALLKTRRFSLIGFYNRVSDKFLTESFANRIEIFDLQSQTTETMDLPSGATPSESIYIVFNRKLLVYREMMYNWYLRLENGWVKSDLALSESSAINASFTKVISQDPQNSDSDSDQPQEWYIYHYW